MFNNESGTIALLKQHYLQLLDDLRTLKKIRADTASAAGRQDTGSPRIKRRIYILRHPRADFSGLYGGLDYSQGRGSTSSLAERDRAVYELGCIDVSDEAGGTANSGMANNAASSGR